MGVVVLEPGWCGGKGLQRPWEGFFRVLLFGVDLIPRFFFQKVLEKDERKIDRISGSGFILFSIDFILFISTPSISPSFLSLFSLFFPDFFSQIFILL